MTATTSPKQHQCTEFCVCPVHGTPLWYAPAHDQHACQSPDCRHAHGLTEQQLPNVMDWYMQKRRTNR